MAQTKAGAAKAMETIRERHGADFHKRIGAAGGRASTTGGFYANRELASEAGRKGGLKSRRNKRQAIYESTDHE